MSVQLSPCPFCGCEARLLTWKDESRWTHDEVDWYQGECIGCEASTLQTEDKDAAIAAWEERAAQPQEKIELIPSGWPLIELGYGKIEVAEGSSHEGTLALIFGKNGTGKIGESTPPDRQHLPGETLAVITFANVESLDVVLSRLQIIRAKLAAQQEGEGKRLCGLCGGAGSIGTGIVESPSYICSECNGTGYEKPAQQEGG